MASLQPIFGGGNTNYSAFLDDHSCEGNEFCTHWDLPTPHEYETDAEGGDASDEEPGTSNHIDRSIPARARSSSVIPDMIKVTKNGTKDMFVSPNTSNT